MVAEVAPGDAKTRTGAVDVGTTGPGPGRRAPAGLIEKFNQAVRRPEDHGGLSVLPLLLDLLAEASQQTEDLVWIPDRNERFGTAGLVRDLFADPGNHVAASQYGEDAHRRGWLRLDRTLTTAEHAVLADRAAAWAGTERAVHDVLDEFGPASVTFGDPSPSLPTSLSYACGDRDAPVVAFHFAPAPADTPSAAVLLVVDGVSGGFLGMRFTPRGRAQWGR